MNVTIVGGGNVGTQLAVHASERGHRTIVYTKKWAEFKKTLTIVDENDVVTHSGKIDCATDDPEKAFANADCIFITNPSFALKKIADEIYPYLKKGVKIGLVPAGGGGEFSFKKHIENGCVLFALQRVPSVARLVRAGDTVRAVGYRDALQVASIPSSCVEACAECVEAIMDMPCIALPNYLNVSLTPSNPILHTTRMRVLFKDYDEKKPYPSVPYFYEDWNNESAELLLACDEEVQEICRAFAPLDASFVKSLKEHYESPTAERLTAKIRSIKGFKGLKTPMLKVEGGYQPDWNSRYFTADFPYGLKMLLDMAKLLQVDTPNMQAVLNWYQDTTGNYDGFALADYGVDTKEKLLQFYSL